MIASTLSAVSAFFFPKVPSVTMAPSSFVLLLSDREWDTEAFLGLHWSGVIASSDPEAALNRFPLKTLAIRKTEDTPAQHEFLITEVRDKDNGDQIKEFALERTVSMRLEPDNATINKFLNHPDSKELLTAIKKIFTVIPSPALVAGAAIAAAPMLGHASSPTVTSVVIPLSVAAIASIGSKPLPSLSLVQEGANSSYLPRYSSMAIVPQYSFIGHTSMSIAQVLQAMSDSPTGRYMSRSLNLQKPPADARAYDRFLGGDKVDKPEYKNGTALESFEPKHLNLFHLALLADVVHDDYPLYALFLRQCYWFANTIYYAAQMIDRDLSPPSDLTQAQDPPQAVNDATDLFYLPFHLYEPTKAGCWKGIRISGCKAVVLSHIVRKFHARLNEYTAMVFFLSFHNTTVY
jgi:hypothetical protein